MSTEANTSTQVETLKQSMKAREDDNQKLRGELKVTQEKLQRSEETKEVLVSSIVKLQDIVRFLELLCFSMMCNHGYSRLAIPL